MDSGARIPDLLQVRSSKSCVIAINLLYSS